jgi:hypothetical protein
MGRRRIALLLAIGLLFVLVPSAAAKQQAPSHNVIEFGAGEVCAFPISIEDWSWTRTKTVVRNGQEYTVIVGPALNLVTNLDTGAKTKVRTSGRVVIWEPGDGTQRTRATGRTLFYFFPGDKNPRGEGNGLYLAIGRARQTLDLGSNVVTRFHLSGRSRDICARID